MTQTIDKFVSLSSKDIFHGLILDRSYLLVSGYFEKLGIEREFIKTEYQLCTYHVIQ